ncbi:hypothetical protein, conserved [Babesia ovata]|uniref:Uncharacterized protein n=1 Tax=Babesia ovata TaxID=189622 RepID=A0A2H6KKI2_9APIC|nr:uncharacterized protein BOVATA_049980 [Babesia ovata]GBE63505.1 hypothetical protein, conserved [Babesia ovata]
MLRTTIQGWLDEIYAKDPVNTHMTSVMNSNIIAVEEVKKKISTYIIKITDASAITPNLTGKVKENLESIQKFLNDFAGKVEPGQAEEMTGIVYTQLQGQRGLPVADRSQLGTAVKCILSALYAASRRVKEQLELLTTDRFSDYHLGKEVEAAITKIGEIGNEFVSGTSKATAGKAIDNAFVTVKEKIKDLEKVLNKSSGSIKSTADELSNTLREIDDLKKEKDSNGNNDGVINKERNQAAEKLDSLKITLNNKLFNIRHVVLIAGDALTKITRALRSALSEANSEVNNAISDLTRDLLDATERTFDEITKRVKEQFAASHKSDLTALKSLVDTQIPEVKR